MIVADTDVLIDALQGREPAVARITERLRAGTLATTAITRFELLSGAKTPEARERVETLLAAMLVLDFDETAASVAAAARLDLENRGIPTGMADYLIAGICIARTATLLTRNRDHFQRITGLRVEGLGED